MALIQMNYLSKTLGMHQSLNIILPEDDSYLIHRTRQKT